MILLSLYCLLNSRINFFFFLLKTKDSVVKFTLNLFSNDPQAHIQFNIVRYKQSLPSPVCTGTKNALSSTGTPEQHYNNLKERYTGCEIVMGNLEITQMENDLDFSFLRVGHFLYIYDILI